MMQNIVCFILMLNDALYILCMSKFYSELRYFYTCVLLGGGGQSQFKQQNTVNQ